MAESFETLPDEQLKASPPRVVFRSVALAAVLLVLTNGLFAALLWTRPVNQGYYVARTKWQMLEALKEPVDYLLLGDSSCNQGLDPAVIEETLGGTALNLCTIGDMLLVNDAWLLQRYLERFGPPKAVLLAHVYDIWPRNDDNLKLMLWNIDMVSTRWRAFEPQLDLDLATKAHTRLGAYVPLYAQPLTVGDVLQRPWLLAKPLPHFAKGFMRLDTPRPEQVERDAAEHLTSLAMGEFTISAVNRAALARIVELARERSFPVYFAHSPVYEKLYASPAYARRITAIDALLAEYHDELEVLAEPAAFPAGAMESADHLTSAAARLHSTRIALALQDKLTMAARPMAPTN